ATVSVGASNNLGDGSGTNNLSMNNGRLLLTGAISGSNRKITLSGSGGTVDTNGFDATFGAIDPGNFTKNGNGTMHTSSINANNLTVNAGTLHVRATGTVPPAQPAAGRLGFPTIHVVGPPVNDVGGYLGGTAGSTSMLTAAPVIAGGGRLDIEDNAL